MTGDVDEVYEANTDTPLSFPPNADPPLRARRHVSPAGRRPADTSLPNADPRKRRSADPILHLCLGSSSIVQLSR